MVDIQSFILSFKGRLISWPWLQRDVWEWKSHKFIVCKNKNRFYDKIHRLTCNLLNNHEQQNFFFSTMETEVIALYHICCELFSIVDMTKHLSGEVELPIGDTTINFSI